MAAIQLGGKDRAAGRERFRQLWGSLEPNDKAGRLVLAHFIADLQDDVDDEVRWDEIALDNVDGVSDADVQALNPAFTVRALVPSLQLNLADGYRRQCRFDDAERALAASVAQNDALPADEPEQAAYRQLILDGQQRAGERIAARDSTSTLLDP